MTTYKERKKKQHNFVLMKGDEVLGTFGNLKKITEFINDNDFPSYWTLIRKKENPIKFNDYRIFKTKHY